MTHGKDLPFIQGEIPHVRLARNWTYAVVHETQWSRCHCVFGCVEQWLNPRDALLNDLWAQNSVEFHKNSTATVQVPADKSSVHLSRAVSPKIPSYRCGSASSLPSESTARRRICQHDLFDGSVVRTWAASCQRAFESKGSRRRTYEARTGGVAMRRNPVSHARASHHLLHARRPMGLSLRVT